MCTREYLVVVCEGAGTSKGSVVLKTTSLEDAKGYLHDHYPAAQPTPQRMVCMALDGYVVQDPHRIGTGDQVQARGVAGGFNKYWNGWPNIYDMNAFAQASITEVPTPPTGVPADGPDLITEAGQVAWFALVKRNLIHEEIQQHINPPLEGSTAHVALAIRKPSECVISIGFVIFDVVCLAIGGPGLRAGMPRSTAEAMAHAAAPVLSKLETIIAKMAATGASKTDLASGTFQILKTIWNGNCGGAVVGAFVGSLQWYTAMLYAVTAMGTIVAALATNGAVFVAEVAIELATFGFLVDDCIKATKACK